MLGCYISSLGRIQVESQGKIMAATTKTSSAKRLRVCDQLTKSPEPHTGVEMMSLLTVFRYILKVFNNILLLISIQKAFWGHDLSKRKADNFKYGEKQWRISSKYKWQSSCRQHTKTRPATWWLHASVYLSNCRFTPTSVQARIQACCECCYDEACLF